MSADWKPLPLTGDAFRNADETELDAISALVQDGYVNDLGNTIKRPGLTTLVDLGTSQQVDGLYWSDVHNLVYAVSGGRTFKITDPTGTKTELTGATMALYAPVTFMEDGTRIGQANGGKFIYSTPSGSTLTSMADMDAPTTITHVRWIDGYALALDTTNDRNAFSDVNDMTAWTAGNTFTANASPDKQNALNVGWREVVLSCQGTTEVWRDDGITPFSRLEGGVIQNGTLSPYTVVQLGNNWAWLDHNKQFVMMDGRTPSPISQSYDKQIQAMSSVEDGLSYVANLFGQRQYVTNFPLANRTLVYNEGRKAWNEWGYWNTTTAKYERFRGHVYCYAKKWGLHVFGDKSNGKIYTASDAVYTDAGDPIRTLRRTGFITHGTHSRKISSGIIFRCKRGAGNSSVTDPQMMVRWRDSGGAWSNERYLSLGQVGQHQLEAKLIQPLGIYRFRQYEIAHSDASYFELTEAKERVEVLAD